ncbi:amidase [Litoribacter alkaliphilus]|uniref:Amidase n=1 Tax=Litoribacter ruber TaxID=702568 RepID=A0AAP2CE95_9BACT|nr:amidase [Litoribacter alkaliphilus]MBS9522663.1 amidase [Litoribacter alkaliphilus]
MMYSFIFKSATELASLIREQKASSEEIVKEHLDYIKSTNNKFNALISIFEEEALETARSRDVEAKNGQFLGPLHGVPVTIKEQFWIKGKSSTANFKMLKDFVGPEDAVVVQRIKASGAVILGQTNVPQNLLDFQVWGDLYPEGKNPYNLVHTPGGSTGGGAAALAAGFTPLELGTDFGGSVRIPASFCGLYGLKPTDKTVPLHGNLPLPKGANTFLIHMAQAGPLARNLDDVETLWNIIKGPHESDRNIPLIDWKKPVEKPLSEYKIAWTDSWPGYETSNEVSSKLKDLIGKLEKEGTQTHNQPPVGNLHEDSLRLFMSLFPYVISNGTPWFVRAIIKFQLKKGLLKRSPRYWDVLKKAFKLNVNHYAEVMLTKSKLTQKWEEYFKEYEFLICPVAFGPAYERCKLGSKLKYEGKELNYLDYVFPYLACFNASGNPSVTIPLGLSKEGLPVGVQIVGPHWSEPQLLEFAKKVASLTKGFIQPTGLFKTETIADEMSV